MRMMRLGKCKALSEVSLALIHGENFVKYGNLRTVEEVKNDISKRCVIRRTVISLLKLINYSCTDDPIRLLQFGQVH